MKRTTMRIIGSVGSLIISFSIWRGRWARKIYQPVSYQYYYADTIGESAELIIPTWRLFNEVSLKFFQRTRTIVNSARKNIQREEVCDSRWFSVFIGIYWSNRLRYNCRLWTICERGSPVYQRFSWNSFAVFDIGIWKMHGISESLRVAVPHLLTYSLRARAFRKALKHEIISAAERRHGA
jgi:hypothetical protein